MNPIHISKPHFPKIHLDVVFLVVSSLQASAPLTSPMHATFPAHLILLALIALTILGEEYKPCSSSL
jgi:hypothetical protein